MMKRNRHSRLFVAIAGIWGLHGLAHGQLIINDTLTGGSATQQWTAQFNPRKVTAVELLQIYEAAW